MNILETKNITKRFEGVTAVDRLSVVVKKGSVTAFVGPNGSGKTTLINLLSGMLVPDGGTVTVNGTDIKSPRPQDAHRHRITRTFQSIRLFEQMTALDNVIVVLTKRPVLSAMFESDTDRIVKEAEYTLRLVGLSEKRDALAGDLSYGQRKLLEIGRAIATDADIYLLDEPFAGLFPEMVKSVSDIIRDLKQRGKTVILVEHNMDIIRELSDTVIVMDGGKLLSQGKPERVLAEEKVIRAYIGKINMKQNGKKNDNEKLLRTRDVTVTYGGITALDRVSISLDEGEIVALMGPNGAGKSTVLGTIFGLAPISSGMLYLHNRPFTPIPHNSAQHGISFVPQGRRVFPGMTVKENLEVGGHHIRDADELNNRIESVTEMFPALKRKKNTHAGTLSGGQQQMLALARGLMTDPNILLLDEPSLGLAPNIVREVFETISEIHRNRNTAIMIVEHNIQSLLTIAHRGYVLDKGKIVADDTADNLIKSDILEKVFTGKM